MSNNPRRLVRVIVLPGEPTDGSGRACIHLFVQDDKGIIVETHALHEVRDEDGNPIKGQLEARPTRGRLACNPKKKVAPVTKGNVTTITMRTDDPRAVTCPRCIASVDYKNLAAKLQPS